jgi:hypothetical protein
MSRLMLLLLMLASPAGAAETVQQIDERAAAEIDAIRQEDAAEKRELSVLVDGGTLRDEARAAQLIDRIISNGTRVTAILVRRAQELRRVMSPAQFAKMVAEQR